MASYADFTGGCGQNQQATSSTALQLNQGVRLNGNTDLSGCMTANDGGCIYGITLLIATNPLYEYCLNVDGQGPSGAGSGSMYLLFTDQTNDTYSLSLYSSKRKMHTVSYNSDKPAIWKIQWSNTPFAASAGHTLLTPGGKKYETSLDIR
jgi:hypothetical protein